MAKSPDEILKELEVLAGEINSKEEKKSKTHNKKQSSKKKKKEEKADVKETIKLREIKKSLDVLEKEVFVKIDNPNEIINNLVESKKVIKDITVL